MCTAPRRSENWHAEVDGTWADVDGKAKMYFNTIFKVMNNR